MIYLGCQHCVKMIVMQYDDMYPALNVQVARLGTCSCMQLNQNQHSLYDIYVHGVRILLMLVSNVTYA